MTEPDVPRETPSRHQRLEQFTGFVLGLVLLALGWILVRSFAPGWLEWGSEEEQVISVLAVLTFALALVTVVALLHTRSR